MRTPGIIRIRTGFFSHREINQGSVKEITYTSTNSSCSYYAIPVKIETITGETITGTISSKYLDASGVICVGRKQ